MKIYVSFAFLLLIEVIFAQSIEVSPYSAFGYGDKRLSNGAASYAMGGLSTAYQSPFGTESNFMNPAANQNLRLTNFIFEGTANLVNFDNGEDNFSRSATYVSRVSLGFPMGKKFRAGFGFQPFSSVGYYTTKYDYDAELPNANRFQGDGGLNAFQIMASYNITPELAIGLRTDYLFGTLNKTETFTIADTQLDTQYSNVNDINGFTFNTGLSYVKKIDEDKTLNIGATYGVGSKLNADQEYMVKTYQTLPTDFTEFNIDTVQYNQSDTKVNMPASTSFGVSYGEDYKWNVGAQVDYETTSNFSLTNQTDDLNNRFRTAIGGYYIPQFNSFRNYFARATYRAGAYYEQTPLKINGEDITDYGITFGIGLPVGKVTNPSELNIGVALGQRGTTNSNLIKENYANVKLSFTLNDAWFKRRKYD